MGTRGGASPYKNLLSTFRRNELITGIPVAQPSYKMGSVFPSGTNRTLACSARAQDISVCVECVE